MCATKKSFKGLPLRLLLQNYKRPSELKKLNTHGIVMTVRDGVAVIHGLKQVFSGETVLFLNLQKINGLVFNLERKSITRVLILGNEKYIKPGQYVYRNKTMLSVEVSPYLLGRVLDGLGNVTDIDSSLILEKKSVLCKIDVKAPKIITRSKVNEPLYTGITLIDSIIPIGRGQRELIIGDRQTGKTTLMIDIILNQTLLDFSDEPVFCIYVSIGQKRSSIAQIYQHLKMKKAIYYTTIISATSADPAPLQYLAPYTGCTIGEFFRDRGFHSLVIYDDLLKHANAYRQMALLLKRTPSREAYPGDIFYTHARLLERAAKLCKDFGAGSLTALPIVETKNGIVSTFIPTNLISITDGQIFLGTKLFKKGIKPAVNINTSVSRVGSLAQTKIMKELSGVLKIKLAKYWEVQIFSALDTSLDLTTQYTLQAGWRIIEMLKQKKYTPLSLLYQIIIIYTSINNEYILSCDLDLIEKFKKFIWKFLIRKKAEWTSIFYLSLTFNLEFKTIERSLKHTIIKTLNWLYFTYEKDETLGDIFVR